MNAVQRNHFKEYFLADTHWHLAMPETLEITIDLFRMIKEYYCVDRIGLMGLSRSSARALDPANNLKALYIKDLFNDQWKDSTFVYGSPIHYYDDRDTAQGYLEQVETLYEMGVDGYKMLDGKPLDRKRLGKKLFDPIFDQMYGFMEENGLPLKLHVADPPEFWGDPSKLPAWAIRRGYTYGDGTFPSFQELHDEVYEILEKFPKLKLCVAHGFFLTMDIEQLTSYMERWENTSIDLTPAAMIFAWMADRYEQWQEFFEKYHDRIFFGTDTENQPAGYANEEIMALHSNIFLRKILERDQSAAFDHSDGKMIPLGLTEDTIRDIYYNNHARLHPVSRKVNSALVLSEAEKLYGRLERRELVMGKEEEYFLELHNLQIVIEHFRNKV